jgi:hypothetical protein
MNILKILPIIYIINFSTHNENFNITKMSKKTKIFLPVKLLFVIPKLWLCIEKLKLTSKLTNFCWNILWWKNWINCKNAYNVVFVVASSLSSVSKICYYCLAFFDAIQPHGETTHWGQWRRWITNEWNAF